MKADRLIEAQGQIFDRFLSVLSNVAQVWEGGDPLQVGELLKLIFPDGFVISGDTCRTPRLNILFSLTADNQALPPVIRVDGQGKQPITPVLGHIPGDFRTDIEQLKRYVALFRIAV